MIAAHRKGKEMPCDAFLGFDVQDERRRGRLLLGTTLLCLADGHGGVDVLDGQGQRDDDDDQNEDPEPDEDPHEVEPEGGRRVKEAVERETRGSRERVCVGGASVVLVE